MINNKEKVYKLCSQIKRNQFSTYKLISDFLNISPRLVGQILKVNPYKEVPCHRVISSSYFIGGFRGQWGKGDYVNEKIKKLAEEELTFNEKGYLNKEFRDKSIFKDFHE